MDFSPSPTLQPILDKVSRFIRDEAIPLERQFHGSFRKLLPELGKLRQRVKELGLWAPQLPRELGGMGLSLLEHGLVSEVLGRTPLGHYLFNCQAPDAGNMEILITARHRRAEEALARAAGARRDPQLLLHDRARAAGLEPDAGWRRRRGATATTTSSTATSGSPRRPTARRSPSSWR